MILFFTFLFQVTGANKGIGFAIVEGLCKRYDGIVYLTARNITRGDAAVTKLKKEGFNPRFHQLDISDQISVEKFRDHIKNEHGGLDVLVNNAAEAYNVRNLTNIYRSRYRDILDAPTSLLIR